MKLCASRAFWLVADPSQGHEMLFDTHNRGFASLGGVSERGFCDNVRTAVDKVKKRKDGEVNSRFNAICSHYPLGAELCNLAAGWEKEVVEKNAQDSRRRIRKEVLERRWGSFVKLYAWHAERCRPLWSEIRPPEPQHFRVFEMLEFEREHLLLVHAPFDCDVHKLARVSSTCLMSIAGKRVKASEDTRDQGTSGGCRLTERGRQLRVTPFASCRASMDIATKTKGSKPLHLSTAKQLAAGFGPLVNIESARWLRSLSARKDDDPDA